MLEKPELPDERILSTLSDRYDLFVERLEFMPRGADRNTAAYRAMTGDGEALFVKLRRGAFDGTPAALARHLRDQGVQNVIAPLATTTGELWTGVAAYTLVVFPFLDGRDGYEVALSESQWCELGRALRKVHGMTVPAPLASQIAREAFSPRWRRALVTHLENPGVAAKTDSIAAELTGFMKDKRGQILDLVQRAERLADQLQSAPMVPVLCHSDIHAGNVVVTEDGQLYVVDWDEPIFAPKERDLMFIGAGLWGDARSPQEEQVVFYKGYGRTGIDPVAIAYYRYERIVEDIAIFFERISSAGEGREDRQQSLDYLRSNFLPRGTIELAYASDETRGRANSPQ
jgi:spectinomycin phosphotransferase